MNTIIKDEITRKIKDFRELGLLPYIHRDCHIHTVENTISTIIGCRRSGKSFRTLQIIDELIAHNFINSIDQVCILDFDNPILANMNAIELTQIQSSFLQLNPDYTLKTHLVFIFDEIHKITGWEDYVVELSRNPNWKIIVTGSSSKLLRDDIATGLRGKSITTELYPLSFKENLRFNGIENPSLSTRGKAEIDRAFDEYLKWGSFPVIPQINKVSRNFILREYFDTMILRDIIQRYNISAPQQCIKLYHYLLSNMAKPYTAKSAYLFLKEQGFSTSNNAISNYIKYAEDSWLLFSMPIFTDSIKVEGRNYKKLYCIDWALANHNCITWDGYYSRAFENMIYLNLRQKFTKIRYYLTKSSQKEVDFIVCDNNHQPIMAIQASMNISDERTRKRELDAIIKTAQYFNLKDNFIITMNEEQIIHTQGVIINIIPAHKWLLEI